MPKEKGLDEVSVQQESENLPAVKADEYAVTTIENRPMSLADFTGLTNQIDQVIEDFLKKDSDYGVIPGTGTKPVLLKPGAEKLMKVFNLGVKYEVVDRIEDFFRQWQYDKWDNDKKAYVKADTMGFYHYRVRADFHHLLSGRFVGSCEGSCDSTERGKEKSPGNTVLKVAQKRAFVGGVLNITYSSDRFTADIEDLQGDQAISGGGSAAPDTILSAEDKAMGIEFKMRSKVDGGYCQSCNRKHGAVGDIVCKAVVPGKEDRNAVWSSYNCFRAVWRKAHGKADAADEGTTAPLASEPKREESMNPQIRAILRLEDSRMKGWPQKEREEYRTAHIGTNLLQSVDSVKLGDYITHLQESLS